MTIDELTYLPAMPENPKVRPIMLIGAGQIIHDSHIPAYRMAGYEIAGIYNRTIDKAKEVAQEFDIANYYDDLDQIIKDGTEMDAVFDIALPANLFKMVLEKLNKGAYVLMQKPMGESLEEAAELLEICRRKDLIAGVNFQLRQAPYMIQLRELLKEGLIGEVYDVDWRLTVNHPWHLWTFLNDKERCEINYHSIHYIDAIRSLFGDPSAVYCKTMMSPKAKNLAQTRSTIILDYGDYLRANISSNHGHDYATDYQESYLKLEGTKGAIKLTLGLILDYPHGKPDKLEYITYETKEWRELPLVGSWFPEAFIGTMGGLLKKIEDPSYVYMNDVEDAYKTMCTVEACYKSNEEGATPIDYSLI